MRKIAVALIGTILFINCNSKELKNQWADKPISIDGNYGDWEGFELQFFENENLIMGTVNDAENLYVMFRFADQRLARKIQMMGVTIWLDKEAKKEKSYGVKYSGSVDLHIDNRPKISTSDQSPVDSQERKPQFLNRLKANVPDPGKIWLIQGEEKIEIAENQISGVSAGSANHNGLYCYEFRIPIPMRMIENNKFSFCLELGGLSQEQLSEMREQMRGMGRGRPGGIAPGGPGSMKELFEKKEIWMNIILAEK